MLSHPQKAGKNTLLVYRELTTWENDKSKQKNDNVILGHLKKYRVFIQPHLLFSPDADSKKMYECKHPWKGGTVIYRLGCSFITYVEKQENPLQNQVSVELFGGACSLLRAINLWVVTIATTVLSVFCDLSSQESE